MRSAVLPFPSRVRARPVKVSLRADTQRDVNDLIRLAPFLGEQNPEGAAHAVRYVRLLIPNPPPPTGTSREVERATAADAGPRVGPPMKRRSAVEVRLAWLHTTESLLDAITDARIAWEGHTKKAVCE